MGEKNGINQKKKKKKETATTDRQMRLNSPRGQEGE